jgi:hypothetical protein
MTGLLGAKAFIAHVFQVTENSSFEEDFGVSKFVFCWIKLKSQQNLLCHNFTVNKPLWDSIWCQDAVSLFELSVNDSAGVSFTANTNSFKYTVTLELVKYQFSINKT